MSTFEDLAHAAAYFPPGSWCVDGLNKLEENFSLASTAVLRGVSGVHASSLKQYRNLMLLVRELGMFDPAGAFDETDDGQQREFTDWM